MMRLEAAAARKMPVMPRAHLPKSAKGMYSANILIRDIMVEDTGLPSELKIALAIIRIPQVP